MRADVWAVRSLDAVADVFKNVGSGPSSLTSQRLTEPIPEDRNRRLPALAVERFRYERRGADKFV